MKIPFSFRLAACLFLLASSLPFSSAAAGWDGQSWADYSQFLGPIDSGMKQHLRTILSSGQQQGRTPGRMGQIGDSITYSDAYFRNAEAFDLTNNETGHDYGPVRSWIAYDGTQPADGNSFYRDHGKGSGYGNESGWTLFRAISDGHPDKSVLVGDGTTPGNFSWVLIMFGTNDINDPNWNANGWKSDYHDFIQGYIDLGVIPVLSTIPPSAEHLDDGRVDLANQKVLELSSEMQVPYVDFHALVIYYQPDSWVNSLISSDGIHPSAGGGGVDFSKDGLTSTDGYAARTKLSFDIAEKLQRIVFDDGAPDGQLPAKGQSMGSLKSGFSGDGS